MALRAFPRSFGVGFFLLAATLTLHAQTQPRILKPVGTETVRLHGSTHALAAPANEIGRAAAALPMERMMLQLSSGADREAALERLIAGQYDPASRHYHQWLTPEQFGAQFGPAQADLDAVVAWLTSQGFAVAPVAAGRRTIEFSGTAGQVERAFRTEMHRYRVEGVEHVANSMDISIPEALTPVVAGVVSLHNFGARPLHHTPPRAVPLTNLQGGAHALSPWDFATIYDVNALWNLNYDGAGQSVAIAGRTNINTGDVATFRSNFGLPAGNVQVVLNGKDPGIVSSDEETEADLDVEWSGAVAKGAAIKLVVSKSTNASDGVDLSDQYIVNNNLASVMSVSFGYCEAQGGSSNAFYNSLWQQAAAEGMSVFVAAGDNGSAGCDDASSGGKGGANTTRPASGGFAVSGLASTPYNVAVGGTQFNDGSGNYWSGSNSSATVASALGYIPETAWNESAYTTAGALGNGLWAGSGGVSALYATPAWQTGAGVPTVDPGTTAQHHRYLPDVSLNGAGHDGYLIYQEGQLELVGGTSAASPSFAGLMAIIDQYTGGRNGNPNTRLYALAAQNPAAFHDVTGGTNAVPCAGGSPNCSSTAAGVVGTMNGYSAGAGYDLATGLGSVDAYALALKWSSGAPALTISSLSPNPMTASASSQTLTINGSGFATGAVVHASSGSSSGTLAVTSLTATRIQATILTGTALQSWSIQVVNPNNAASNAATLTVTAPAPVPSVTSVSPNPMTGSNSAQTLTIAGSGFATGDTVQATYSGGAATTLTPSSVSASKILVAINVGTTARMWSITVVNANKVASNTASLTVTAPATPAPWITSISPNPMTGSASSQTLSITGSGFASGDIVHATYSGGPVTTLTPTSVSASKIQASINVGTTARTWSITVVSANNSASNAASLGVTAPVTTAVTIASLNPNPMTGANGYQLLTINGTGFASGDSVRASYAGGPTATLPVASISATQIQAYINTGAAARTWSITVFASNNQASNTASLTVTAPVTPAITAVSNITATNTNQILTITGTGFTPGSGLQVVVGYNGRGTYYPVISATATQIQVQIDPGTAKRTWEVEVIDPGGAISNVATFLAQ